MKLYIRWMCTQFCNYKCFYCPQQHQRKQIYKGSPGHWADNRPVEDWVEAFTTQFSRYATTFHLTGGEPMLDAKNTAPLMRFFAEAPWVEHVELDTNGSFHPDRYAASPKFKLHVSYHPTEVTLDKYVAQVEGLVAAGWFVMVMALVVRPDAFGELDALAAVGRRLRIPLNVMTLDGRTDGYTEEQLAVVDRFVNPVDAYHSGSSPLGKPCLYPSVAYEVDPDGSLIVPCHRGRPWAHGNLFGGELPARPVGYNPCPKRSCSCEERYTHLQELGGVPEGLSPKMAYAARAAAWQKLEVL